MRVIIHELCEKWLHPVDLSVNRVVKACTSAATTQLRPPAGAFDRKRPHHYFAFDWQSTKDIVCVAAEASLKFKGNKRKIREVTVRFAARLRPNLPSGRLSRHLSIPEIFQHLGQSFGLPITLHPFILPQRVYSGPIDPSTAADVLNNYPKQDECYGYMDYDSNIFCAIHMPTYVKWFRSGDQTAVIDLPAVWRCVADNIGHDSTRVQDAATILEGLCDEFYALIEDGASEETLHQWLKEERHQLFLDPLTDRLWSKLSFGGKESDFVIRHPDGTYRLIEIERATAGIFRNDNSEPTAEFNHARQQVRDWQRYIRDNAHTVRTELDLKDIDQPRGVIIIGRTARIRGKEAETRWRDMKNRGDPEVYTYDEIINRVRTLAKNLRTNI